MDRVSSFLALARDLGKIHGLPSDWNIVCDRARRRAGLCHFGKRRISLSRYMLENPAISSSEIKNIILHEIAHALVGHAAGHGPIWQAKAIEIGCDGKRCHNLVLSTPKDIITCPCGAVHIPVYRRSKLFKNMEYRICKQCQQPLRLYCFLK